MLLPACAHHCAGQRTQPGWQPRPFWQCELKARCTRAFDAPTAHAPTIHASTVHASLWQGGVGGIASWPLCQADATGGAASHHSKSGSWTQTSDVCLALTAAVRVQGLLDTFLHQPIRQNAPGAPLAQEARHSMARAQRFEKAMRAVLPPATRPSCVHNAHASAAWPLRPG